MNRTLCTLTLVTLAALPACGPASYSGGTQSEALARGTNLFPRTWSGNGSVQPAATVADVPSVPPPAPPAQTVAAAPTPVVTQPEVVPAPVPVAPAAPAAQAFVRAAPQPTAYAIIIGVEKYSNNLPPPTGARADAEHFALLAQTSLGISPDHIQLITDEHATKGAIERTIAWAQASTPPGGRIYFYFSGHGAPNPQTGASYLVPSDGDPRYLDVTAIPINTALTRLSQSKAREVLAVLDSCFSGAGGRSVLPPGARPLVRVHDDPAPAQLAIFTASSGSQISGPTAQGDGGLFTKYVLDGLGDGLADVNGDGQVSLAELSQWVSPRVAREAKRDNRDQNPSLVLGKKVGSPDNFIVQWGLPVK